MATKLLVARGAGNHSRAAAGQEAEAAALAHLQAQGLRLVQKNYRVAAGPRAPAGEVDLVMVEPRSGTLVFVEVRHRATGALVAAAESVNPRKQARLIYAARHFLLRRGGPPPPCRFDVVAVDGTQLQWLPAAFDAPV
jgi:putative endonuclease